MTITCIAADLPSPAFAAMFTRNAFPGAPVIVGRQRLASAPALGAIVINNKISNVRAPGGVATAERVCAAAAGHLGMPADAILPSSTGVIGWRLPETDLIAHLPEAVAALQAASILPAAEGICTTDLYPKIRRAEVPGGSIVGIAKGAGMIEPNLATMLVYLLTDVQIDRATLDSALRDAVAASFNRMTIDSDTSTSDTVVALSSLAGGPCPAAAFRADLAQVCAQLCEDVVRNGEGVHHVVRYAVTGAPDVAVAEAIGKAVANSPLFQCAVCGNDPNVGRLVAAIGREAGAHWPGLDLSRLRLTLGGITVYEDGAFRLDGKEQALVAHLRQAEMYASVPPADGLTFRPPVSWPPHERCVEVGIHLGVGGVSLTVLGADRTHEYISENADYRS
jgi:glutamate N-acetyltransferase/amino-acid N-acetyltransferase